MEKIEEYTTDQFIARDFLKELNSFVRINILGQKDNDKLFEKDGAIYKMEYPINTAYIEKSANKINEIYEKAIIGELFKYLNEDDKEAFLKNFDKEKLFNTNNYYLFYEDTEKLIYEFVLFIIDIKENKLYYILSA